MPIYSAKSDTQYAAPGHRHLRSRSCRIEFASPGCQWRPGDFLLGQYCLMLSMESMIAISSRRGGGGRQTFPVPLSRKFLRYLSFLSFSRDPGRAAKSAARGEGNRRREIWDITDCHTSDIGHWFAMTGFCKGCGRRATARVTPTDAFRKCVGGALPLPRAG